MPPRKTEAEDFLEAARVLGLNLSVEDVQRRVIAGKGQAAAEGLTYEQWTKRNLLRFLAGNDEDGDDDDGG
jgi:hypothetical protein